MKITTIESKTVALPIDNIDTDQIIPARFLKTTSMAGLGVHATLAEVSGTLAAHFGRIFECQPVLNCQPFLICQMESAALAAQEN